MSIEEVYIWQNDTGFQPHLACRGRNIVDIRGNRHGFVALGAALTKDAREGIWIITDKDATIEFPLVGTTSASMETSHILALCADFNDVEVKSFRYSRSDSNNSTIATSSYSGHIIDVLRKRNVVKVSYGDAHSAAITANGDLYTWGRGFEGQLGNSRFIVSANNTGSFQLTPRVVKFFQPLGKPHVDIAFVDCGNNFTVAVTSTGAIYSFGEGSCGQLGVGTKSNSHTPLLCLPSCPKTNCKISKVSAGYAHVLALTENGHIYSWGLNCNGQLGLGDTISRYFPEVINYEDKIVKDICAFSFRSGAVTECGSAYIWGKPLQHIIHNAITNPEHLKVLDGKTVSKLCFSETSIAVILPFTIKKQSIHMAAISANSCLTLYGSGFWNSNEIIVRFIYTRSDEKTLIKTASGTFIRSEKSNEYDKITCKTPLFHFPCTTKIEVSIDSAKQTFIDTGCVMKFYKDPTIISLSSLVCRLNKISSIRIDATDLEGFITASDVTVVFSDLDKKETYKVPGKIFSESIDAEIDKSCKFFVKSNLPLTKTNFPYFFRVSIIPDSASDISSAVINDSSNLIIFHDACIESIYPHIVPYNSSRRVIVKGKSLYSSEQLGVRLSWDDNNSYENRNHINVEDVIYENESISFCIPTDLFEFCNPTLGVFVEATLDGFDFFSLKESLCIYRENIYSLRHDSMFHPVSGNTNLQVLVENSNTRNLPFISDCALVQLKCIDLELDILIPSSTLNKVDSSNVESELSKTELTIPLPSLVFNSERNANRFSFAGTFSLTQNGIDFSTPLSFTFYKEPEITSAIPTAVKDLKCAIISLNGKYIQQLSDIIPIVVIESCGKIETNNISIDAEIVSIDDKSKESMDSASDNEMVIRFQLPMTLAKEFKFPIKIRSFSLDRNFYISTELEIKWSGKKK